MSEMPIQPLPTNLFAPNDSESRWVTILAFLATIFVHLGVILVIPDELMPQNKSDTSQARKEAEIYEISLVDPVDARFVEASPEAPENEPDRRDQYS